MTTSLILHIPIRAGVLLLSIGSHISCYLIFVYFTFSTNRMVLTCIRLQIYDLFTWFHSCLCEKSVHMFNQLPWVYSLKDPHFDYKWDRKKDLKMFFFSSDIQCIVSADCTSCGNGYVTICISFRCYCTHFWMLCK